MHSWLGAFIVTTEVVIIEPMMVRNFLAATQVRSGWVSQMCLVAWFLPVAYFWFLTTPENSEWQLFALALQLPVKSEISRRQYAIWGQTEHSRCHIIEVITCEAHSIPIAGHGAPAVLCEHSARVSA